MAVLPSDKHLARLACCRPDGDPLGSRKTRDALGRMASDPALREAFTLQAGFDAPLAASVRGLPLPAEFETAVQEGLRQAAKPEKQTWRTLVRQPALWAVVLAVMFLAAWAGWAIYEHAQGFPGDDTVRELVESTFTRRLPPLDPLDAECASLGDTLFLRHNLADFEVPDVFAHELAVGYRLFAKNEKPVTLVQTRSNLLFFVFRADSQGVDIVPEGTWKYLEGDDWNAAVQVRHHICFVAVSRGPRKENESRLRVAQN